MTNQQVLILIDDLDRCEHERVVSVMNAVHTLFHTQPVVCIVAADSRWLRQSYTHHFNSKTDGKGERLRMEKVGEQFLEKLFQLQVRLPPVSELVIRSFMGWIFQEWDVNPEAGRQGRTVGSAADGGGHDDTSESSSGGGRRSVERVAQEDEQHKWRYSPPYKIETLLSLGDPHLTELAVARLTGVVSDAALNLGRGRLQAVRPKQNLNLMELLHYAGLVARNPREIKRLINLFSFHKEYQRVRDDALGGSIPNPTLIPWLILEIRWPELARHLVRYPKDIERFEAPSDVEDDQEEQGASASSGVPRICDTECASIGANDERNGAEDRRAQDPPTSRREELLKRYRDDSEVRRVIWRKGIDNPYAGGGRRFTIEEIKTIAERLYDQSDRARDGVWD